ncbi:MAG: glycoside hydrolase family 95 protein [Bacteroidales bacterium]|nr:glycoside hydrolase family 95 protein [Bacteroidales bacterium]
MKAKAQILIFIFFMLFMQHSVFAKQQPMKLWYDKPALDWNQALPLGNGRLGTMVFGNPSVEHLQLNEETIWAGSPNSNAHSLEDGVLERVRELIFEEKYVEAEDLATRKIMSQTNHGMPYQTMGDLFISFPNHEKYTNYYRELDIDEAIASVSYTVDGVQYNREIFTSFTDQVIIVRLSSNRPNSLTCNAFITTPQEKVKRNIEDNQLVLSGITPAHEKQSGKVKFETRLKPIVKGGEYTVKNNIISIKNADEVLFYISIGTNFNSYKDISADQTKRCKKYLLSALSKKYHDARKEHVEFYRNLYDRVKLNLGVTPEVNKPTDERIKNFKNSYDPALAAMYFQFGRYLLISSSQPGGQPANLQGIWNDRYLPSWDSKYTCNINVEMNYWPAECTNLSEMHEPMLQMVREVAETGSETAQVMYNCRGWVLHHNTDIWRITGPVDRAASGMWPVGGAWVSQHLWYRFLYTGDKEYLQSIYPVMRGAAMFFNDFLVEEPTHNWLVVSPSNSPENTHAGSNNKATITAGATIDNQLVFDLFNNVIKATEILGIDTQFADELKAKIDRLPPMQIGKHNQLQEWLHDWDSPDDKHRHVSHLYGLFPSNQISATRTPLLFEAAKNSLIYRGDPSTGWSMGWKLCLWARLLDGEHAYTLLTNQLDLVVDEEKKGGTYSNMLDAHPPFQIDGNFGCTTGIAEMLVQSHDGFIYLLPALPSVWSEGSVKGLVTVGGFVVDMEWNKNRITNLTVYSKYGGNCRIKLKGKLKGNNIKKAKGDNPHKLFSTPKIKQPLISQESKIVVEAKESLLNTNLYDLHTEKGKTYHFIIQ